MINSLVEMVSDVIRLVSRVGHKCFEVGFVYKVPACSFSDAKIHTTNVSYIATNIQSCGVNFRKTYATSRLKITYI